MKHFFTIITVLILALAMVSPALAKGITKDDLNTKQLTELYMVKRQIVEQNALVQAGVLTAEQASKYEEYYLQKALLSINKNMPKEDMKALVNSITAEDLKDAGAFATAWQWISFGKILLFAAACLIFLGLSWVVYRYLFPILVEIPPVVYEVLLYILCALVIIFGKILPGNIPIFYAFLGSLGIAGAWTLTHALHETKMDGFYKKIKLSMESFNSLVFFLIWGAVAVLYNSQILGLMSVGALEVFIGWIGIVMPVLWIFGYKEDDVLPRLVFTSFFLVAFYVFLQLSSFNIPYIGVFSLGVFIIGSISYFIGLMIMGSKWYTKNAGQYFAMQVLIVASGIAALLLGTLGGIMALQKIGGFFFAVWVIKIYVEICSNRDGHWGWFVLGLGVILLAMYFVMRMFPMVFGF